MPSGRCASRRRGARAMGMMSAAVSALILVTTRLGAQAPVPEPPAVGQRVIANGASDHTIEAAETSDSDSSSHATRNRYLLMAAGMSRRPPSIRPRRCRCSGSAPGMDTAHDSPTRRGLVLPKNRCVSDCWPRCRGKAWRWNAPAPVVHQATASCAVSVRPAPVVS